MRTSDLGVAIPQTFHGRPLETTGIRAYMERADALGFDSAWVVEQVLGAIPSLRGDVDACVEGLQRVREARAEFLMLNPVFDELAHLERFAADLTPLM